MEAAARGAKAIGMGGDVVDRDQVTALVDAALSAYGRLDGLVNLAYAHDGPAPLAELSTESLERELHVDVVGGLIAMQAVYPHLRGHGGSIVNFSSGAGVEGLAGRAAYSSAKAAVRLLSRTAALEWGAEGIRVNCVCPFSMSPSLSEAVRAGTVDQAQLDGISPLGPRATPNATSAPGSPSCSATTPATSPGRRSCWTAAGSRSDPSRHDAWASRRPELIEAASRSSSMTLGRTSWRDASRSAPTMVAGWWSVHSARLSAASRRWSSLTKCDGAANSARTRSSSEVMGDPENTWTVS